jgi:hypothetical protein
MSVWRAPQPASPNRGNLIQIFNAKGKLLRTLTIEQFKKERPGEKWFRNVPQASSARSHKRRE